MSNEILASKLAVILSDLATYKQAAHGYHWNVKGAQFVQFHDFFATLYTDADDAIDPLAENIRKLGFDAPSTLSDFVSLACVEPNTSSSDPIDQSRELYSLNAHLIQCQLDAFALANELNQQGIADFLAGRIDVHQKWQWQLGTITGVDKTAITEIFTPTPEQPASEYLVDYAALSARLQ